MKRLYILPLTVLLWNCGETSQKSTENEEVVSDSTEITQETTELNEELTAEEENSFALFEDYYGQIESKTQLYEFFPEEAITEDTTWYAEGTVMMLSSYLKNPENGQILSFVWGEKDNETLYRLEAYHQVYDKNYEVEDRQKIESEYGLYTGMTLDELVEWNNNEPIEFSGFGWDYAGGVFVKEGSKLADCPLGIQLGIDYTDMASAENLLGDVTFSSSDEGVDGSIVFIDLIVYTNQSQEPEY